MMLFLGIELIVVFLLSIPWMMISWVLRKTRISQKKCPTCRGTSFAPVELHGYFRRCECGGDNDNCPLCHGTGLEKLGVGHFFLPCPDCEGGHIPRTWAISLSLEKDREGFNWEPLNKIYG